MAPLLLWAIGTGAGALVRYLIESNCESEPATFVGVGWAGSTKCNLPRVVVRRLMHDKLCNDNRFRRVRSSEHSDEYFRGDESITAMPPSRSITWGEVPLFLTARYDLDGGATTMELHFRAPPSLTFDKTCADTFPVHAEREFRSLLESLRVDAESGTASSNGHADGGNGHGAAAPTDDDYALFGLRRGASWEHVQAAYRDACLKYHPDRFAGQNVPQHLIDLAVREFRERTEAYQRFKAHFAV